MESQAVFKTKLKQTSFQLNRAPGDDLRREMWVTDEAETPKKKKKKGTGYDMTMALPGQMKVKLPELPPAQPGMPGTLFSAVMRFTTLI